MHGCGPVSFTMQRAAWLALFLACALSGQVHAQEGPGSLKPRYQQLIKQALEEYEAGSAGPAIQTGPAVRTGTRHIGSAGRPAGRHDDLHQMVDGIEVRRVQRRQ